jgi:3',5'-cyclic AMP phosphodiesterase CpdA
VQDLNERIHPDVLLLPGDILDNGAAPDACELRQRIALVLDRLRCPHLILPGNHDVSTAQYSQHRKHYGFVTW